MPVAGTSPDTGASPASGHRDGPESPPTAELHVHVEGTLEPAAVIAMAARNGVSLPVTVIIEGVAGSPEPAPFSVSFARVTYDIQAEISVARELGMPDADAYARELLDGIYRGAKAD